jgi:methyl-accepting chemotaxis protein
VCGAVLIAIQVYAQLDAKEQQIGVLADVVGSNCSAAIEFDDPNTASRLLLSLEQQPTVLVAVLTAADGRVVARYHRDEAKKGSEPQASNVSEDTLVVRRDIYRGGEVLGGIYIVASYSDVWDQVTSFCTFAVATLAGVLTLTIVGGRMVQRQLSRPILQLASAVGRVTDEQDLSVRVPATSADELGLLCHGFNAMLGRRSAIGPRTGRGRQRGKSQFPGQHEP